MVHCKCLINVDQYSYYYLLYLPHRAVVRMKGGYAGEVLSKLWNGIHTSLSFWDGTVRSYGQMLVAPPSRGPENTYLYSQKVAVLRRRHHGQLKNRVQSALRWGLIAIKWANSSIEWLLETGRKLIFRRRLWRKDNIKRNLPTIWFFKNQIKSEEGDM